MAYEKNQHIYRVMFSKLFFFNGENVSLCVFLYQMCVNEYNIVYQ